MLEGSGLGAITRDNLTGETILSLATTLDCDPKDLTATYTDIRVTFRAHTGAIPTASASLVSLRKNKQTSQRDRPDDGKALDV